MPLDLALDLNLGRDSDLKIFIKRSGSEPTSETRSRSFECESVFILCLVRNSIIL